MITGFLVRPGDGFPVAAQTREMDKHAFYMHIIANSPQRQ